MNNIAYSIIYALICIVPNDVNDRFTYTDIPKKKKNKKNLKFLLIIEKTLQKHNNKMFIESNFSTAYNPQRNK